MAGVFVGLYKRRNSLLIALLVLTLTLVLWFSRMTVEIGFEKSDVLVDRQTRAHKNTQRDASWLSDGVANFLDQRRTVTVNHPQVLETDKSSVSLGEDNRKSSKDNIDSSEMLEKSNTLQTKGDPRDPMVAKNDVHQVKVAVQSYSNLKPSIETKTRHVQMIPKIPENTAKPGTDTGQEVTVATKTAIKTLATVDQSLKPNKVELEMAKKDSGRKYKTILFYSSLFGSEKWIDINDKQIVDYPQRANCPHADTCKLTYNKSEIKYAEGVIFHAVDLVIMEKYSLSHLRAASKLRPPYQRWIFLSQESPINYNKFQNHSHLFNWTMSYESGADIFYPYNHFHPLTEAEKGTLVTKNWSDGKDKLVIWIVSNCGNVREKYVKALQKYIPISIYGGCASRLGSNLGKCERDSEDCLKIIKRHKFILAFENSFCRDYVSEKFWNPLAHFENVPIVFGANYDQGVVPAESYIDTANFSSIKALADHLLYLDKNHEAYNAYFKWKQKFAIGNADKYCLLCEAIHRQNAPSKSYKDIWSVKRSCTPFNSKLEKYMKIVENDNS